MMAPKKRTYEDAFIHRPLQTVKIGDFYVEHTVYKVIKENNPEAFHIKTLQKSNFDYGEDVIKETATSATLYTALKKVTKTLLIELFSDLSLNDIWHASFFKENKDTDWQNDLVTKIQSIEKNYALKYVKKNFTTFGKTTRELTGQKIVLKSDNNYYVVRDLNIYFDELDANGLELAAKNSIRNLDVNTLQSLIFNSVKYVLKK